MYKTTSAHVVLGAVFFLNNGKGMTRHTHAGMTHINLFCQPRLKRFIFTINLSQAASHGHMMCGWAYCWVFMYFNIDCWLDGNWTLFYECKITERRKGREKQSNYWLLEKHIYTKVFWMFYLGYMCECFLLWFFYRALHCVPWMPWYVLVMWNMLPLNGQTIASLSSFLNNFSLLVSPS